MPPQDNGGWLQTPWPGSISRPETSSSNPMSGRGFPASWCGENPSRTPQRPSSGSTAAALPSAHPEPTGRPRLPCPKRPNARCGFPITRSLRSTPIQRHSTRWTGRGQASRWTSSETPPAATSPYAGLYAGEEETGSSCFLLGSTFGWTVLPPSETNPATVPSTERTCGNMPVSTSREKHPPRPIAVRSSPQRRPYKPWAPSCWSIRKMSSSRRTPWPSPPPAEPQDLTLPTPLNRMPRMDGSCFRISCRKPSGASNGCAISLHSLDGSTVLGSPRLHTPRSPCGHQTEQSLISGSLVTLVASANGDPRQSHLRTRGWLSSLNLIQGLEEPLERLIELIGRRIQRGREPEALWTAQEPKQDDPPFPCGRNQGRHPVRSIEIHSEEMAMAPHFHHGGMGKQGLLPLRPRRPDSLPIQSLQFLKEGSSRGAGHGMAAKRGDVPQLRVLSKA